MNTAVVEIENAVLQFGERVLWAGLDLNIAAGEFLAVLGPNGSGKTSLLRVLLGLQSLNSGTAQVAGRPAGQANRCVGYIPQQRSMEEQLLLRGIDLVGLGLDGHRWGTGFRNRRQRKRQV